MLKPTVLVVGIAVHGVVVRSTPAIFKPAALVVGSGIVMHGAVVGGALLRSIFAPTATYELQQPRRQESSVVKLGQASASSTALGSVLKMYSQGTVTKDSFSPEVSFEDPPAKTEGFAELEEAFRSLKLLSPETLDWEVGSVGEGQMDVNLWQLYTLGSNKFELFSKLGVNYDDAGRVVRIRESWRGVPLLDTAPFTWSRRINGILGSVVTPLFQTDDSKPGSTETLAATNIAARGMPRELTIAMVAVCCVALLRLWRHSFASLLVEKEQEQSMYERLDDAAQ